MTRLFRSEMKRLWSRRLFRWLLVLFVGCLLLVAVLVFMNGAFAARDMPDALLGLSFPLLMVGWLVGATSIGAEWTHRTVTALLTWEPRRTRVLLTKVVAAAVFTLFVVVFLEGVFTASLLPAAGGPSGVDWGEYTALAGRVLFAAVVASLLGFALATIGKNTAAALGGGMAYLLVAESLVRGFKPAWSRWLLGTNIARVIEGGPSFDERTAAGAAVVLALYAAGLLLLALWFFRRREIA